MKTPQTYIPYVHITIQSNTGRGGGDYHYPYYYESSFISQFVQIAVWGRSRWHLLLRTVRIISQCNTLAWTSELLSWMDWLGVTTPG